MTSGFEEKAVTTHNLGFPRIGSQRELKFALESYWRGESSLEKLTTTGRMLRQRHWRDQAGVKLVPVGDFAFYDHVLDMSFTLGNLPERVQGFRGEPLDNYFRVARGRSAKGPGEEGEESVAAGEMTKWFDTNYHYIVPEFTATTEFRLDASRLLEQLGEATAQGVAAKPVIIGPVTYLALGKAKDGSEKLKLLPRLLEAYVELLHALAGQGAQWVQVDEPLLASELASDEWSTAFCTAYAALSRVTSIQLLLTTYFGPLKDNLRLVASLPVHGVHVDATTQEGREEAEALVGLLPPYCVLSVGVISGRNIWKTDLHAVLDWLEPLAHRLGSRLWLAPSCSLLHVPVDLATERGEQRQQREQDRVQDQVQEQVQEQVQNQVQNQVQDQVQDQVQTQVQDRVQEQEQERKRKQGGGGLDPEVESWLSFAVQKLEELRVLAAALEHGRSSSVVAEELAANRAAVTARRTSPRVHRPDVQAALMGCNIDELGQRKSPYAVRAVKQAQRLQLPRFPTTTIGSFPQTAEIRQARGLFRSGRLEAADYRHRMQSEIARVVKEQEALELDVLVHGEPERNDMVEYFGEQLDGYAFSSCGWVQSYGSRCVKPPILYGDVSRPRPMTVEWIVFAQSLTSRPVKGMLTGPVTMLNWSFVRDDQPRSVSCRQLALVVRQEVLDLERAGIRVIQIDEAALREGLPLRRCQWQEYLEWAVDAFRISANGVADETQIHTHMCYSEFNDIIASIADMDADAITIETSRSDMELLDAFDNFQYPNEIGPGVYDIHSPNIPSQQQIVKLMKKAAERIPANRLWVNPDCGLKTRQWSEVLPALTNMVLAAKHLRNSE